MSETHERIHQAVRDRYQAAAEAARAGQPACCGPDAAGFGASRYGDLRDLPAAAVRASLGCGNPIAVAELSEGETVLDLGSGGGIDVLLSARRVGPKGFVYGLDLTPAMVDLARANAAEAGASNVEFLEGTMEAIPLGDATVDVVISNCVINLSPDKAAVFAEIARVLRPGGRIGIGDVVADDRLSPADRAEREAGIGCVAGALAVAEYEAGLRGAGFADVSITFTYEVGDGVHGAIVAATKPASP
jgi:SAM-dependent methyltransferase